MHGRCAYVHLGQVVKYKPAEIVICTGRQLQAHRNRETGICTRKPSSASLMIPLVLLGLLVTVYLWAPANKGTSLQIARRGLRKMKQQDGHTAAGMHQQEQVYVHGAAFQPSPR